MLYHQSSRKSRCICPYFPASISSVACYSVAIWQGQQDLLKNIAISFSLIKHGYPVTIGPQPNVKNPLDRIFWLINFACCQFSPLTNHFTIENCLYTVGKKRRGGGGVGRRGKNSPTPLAAITITLRRLCLQFSFYKACSAREIQFILCANIVFKYVKR